MLVANYEILSCEKTVRPAKVKKAHPILPLFKSFPHSEQIYLL